MRARAIRNILRYVTKPLTITATRYDGSFLRRWPGELQSASAEVVVGVTWAGTRAEAADGNWNVPWHTTAHFWPGRWYNVFRYDDPYRGLLAYHCHIATPPDIEEDHVGFADLGMSLWVPAHGEPEVRDRDTYERQAELFAYPPEVRTEAESALAELGERVRRGEFPFVRSA